MHKPADSDEFSFLLSVSHKERCAIRGVVEPSVRREFAQFILMIFSRLWLAVSVSGRLFCYSPRLDIEFRIKTLSTRYFVNFFFVSVATRYILCELLVMCGWI